MNPCIYWDELMPDNFKGKQPFLLAATSRGLCRVIWPSETFEDLRIWTDKYLPAYSLIHDPAAVSVYAEQIRQYFARQRKSFDFPLDMQGSEFQKQVWQALTQIPYGSTRSYSEIASAINRPKAVRAVGTANGVNPIPLVVPCHRVIGKNSTLTGFGGGLAMKETLLQLEGFEAYINKGHERYKF
jgi:methylated-DNA-[protein]-cysteine S-methyltransferase